MTRNATKLRRALEFIVLFVGIPILLSEAPAISRATGIPLDVPIIPVLVVVSVFVLIAMRRTTSFRLPDLVEISTAKRREWVFMLSRFAILALLLTVALALYKPEGLLRLPRDKPRLWMLVMICYPLASVIPQGIVYRAFYHHRYADLFPGPLRMIVGAAVFSFAHLAFANAYALVFTFLGGLMFYASYRRTRSLLFSSIEHALYGTFLFTIGWGQYFLYAGTLRMLSKF